MAYVLRTADFYPCLPMNVSPAIYSDCLPATPLCVEGRKVPGLDLLLDTVHKSAECETFLGNVSVRVAQPGSKRGCHMLRAHHIFPYITVLFSTMFCPLTAAVAMGWASQVCDLGSINPKPTL